jgi:hypothetical protein
MYATSVMYPPPGANPAILSYNAMSKHAKRKRFVSKNSSSTL